MKLCQLASGQCFRGTRAPETGFKVKRFDVSKYEIKERRHLRRKELASPHATLAGSRWRKRFRWGTVGGKGAAPAQQHVHRILPTSRSSPLVSHAHTPLDALSHVHWMDNCYPFPAHQPQTSLWPYTLNPKP